MAHNRYQHRGPYYPAFSRSGPHPWAPRTAPAKARREGRQERGDAQRDRTDTRRSLLKKSGSREVHRSRKGVSGKKYNKLMIVAHPDDESIFGGAQLLKSRRWKVICVTNGNHPVRRREFRKAMKRTGAKWEIWNFVDRRYGGIHDKRRLKLRLKKAIRKKRIKKFVTHNRAGEYGHSQHKSLSKLVHKLVKKNLYVFHLSKYRVKKEQLRRKKRLLKCYGSQKTIIRRLKFYVKHEAVKKVK